MRRQVGARSGLIIVVLTVAALSSPVGAQAPPISTPATTQPAKVGINPIKDWRTRVDGLCTASNAAMSQAYKSVPIGADGEPLQPEFVAFMMAQLQPNFIQLIADTKATPTPNKIRPKVKKMLAALNKTTFAISPTITKAIFLELLTPAGVAAQRLGLTVCAQ